jgi:hypothetical protein
MTKEEKILAFYGNLNNKSIAIVCQVHIQTVYNILKKNDLPNIRKNEHLSYKNYGTHKKCRSRQSIKEECQW